MAAYRRCWLEESGLRKSIANINSVWEERIRLAFHGLRHTPGREAPKGEDPDSNPVWEAHHQDLHIALILPCSSDILLTYGAEVHQRTFRCTNLSEVTVNDSKDELDEHQCLQAAVLNQGSGRGLLMAIIYQRMKDGRRDQGCGNPR